MYTKADVISSLRLCGIKEGDILFSHSNVGFFGIPDGIKYSDELCALINDAIFSVIGASGTLVVPSFSYSFGNDKKDKIFDVINTKTSMGIFSEYIRNLPESKRSHDPMFSVSAIGSNAIDLTAHVSSECFGKDSFWDRFYKIEGKICNFNFDYGSTFVHYVEKMLSVPYRKDHIFTGVIVAPDGKQEESSVTFFCRNLEDNGAEAKFERFNALAKEKYEKRSSVGRGEIVVITAQETYKLIADTMLTQPNFLTLDG